MNPEVQKDLQEFWYLACEIDAIYHQAALRVGLSDSVMNILYTLSTFDGTCTQSDICKLSGDGRQTIHSAIRKLEQEGLVYLEKSHRKNRPIFLTEKGKLLAQEKVLPLLYAEHAAFAAWPRQERQELLRLTRKYVEGFRKNLSRTQK